MNRVEKLEQQLQKAKKQRQLLTLQLFDDNP